MNCIKSLIYFTVLSLVVLLAEGGTKKIRDGVTGRPEDAIIRKKSETSRLFRTITPRSRFADKNIQKIDKTDKNNSLVVEQLKSFSKDLVTSIMKKLEVQDGITKLTTEALKSVSKPKGMAALESRRILDNISKEISGHIMKNTRSLVQPKLQKFVYGLCQTAAEIAIMSSLKDISWTKTMAYAHHERAFSLRRKRELVLDDTIDLSTQSNMKKSGSDNQSDSSSHKIPNRSIDSTKVQMTQSELFDKDQKKPLQMFKEKGTFKVNSTGRFLNKVVVQKKTEDLSKVDHIVLENKIDPSITILKDRDEEVIKDLFYEESDLGQDNFDEESNKEESLYDPSNKRYLNSDIVAELALDVSDFNENQSQNKKSKHHAEKLETKAEKALKYASDVAYWTASTVAAARRSITSQMEVQMAVKYVKNGLSNHQGLMINLAKSAARKAGSEARNAFRKSVASDRALGVAMKYTAQSHGAKLNNLASRIIMDTVSAASIARSMSFMASKAAMESMFEASDIADA